MLYLSHSNPDYTSYPKTWDKPIWNYDTWEPLELVYIKGTTYPLHYSLLRCCQDFVDEVNHSSFEFVCINIQGKVNVTLMIFYGLHLGLVNVVKRPGFLDSRFVTFGEERYNNLS